MGQTFDFGAASSVAELQSCKLNVLGSIRIGSGDSGEPRACWERVALTDGGSKCVHFQSGTVDWVVGCSVANPQPWWTTAPLWP